MAGLGSATLLHSGRYLPPLADGGGPNHSLPCSCQPLFGTYDLQLVLGPIVRVAGAGQGGHTAI